MAATLCTRSPPPRVILVYSLLALWVSIQQSPTNEDLVFWRSSLIPWCRNNSRLSTFDQMCGSCSSVRRTSHNILGRICRISSSPCRHTIHPLGRNNLDCCARRKFSKNSQNQGRSTNQIPYFFSFLYSVQNGEEEVILISVSYVDILFLFLYFCQWFKPPCAFYCCVHFSLRRKLSILRSSTGAQSCLLSFSRHFSLCLVVGGNSPREFRPFFPRIMDAFWTALSGREWDE